MAVSRTTNTQVEALKGLIQQISDIKTFPDADLPFLLGLETEIISYIRKPMEDMVGQMPPGAGAGGPGPGAAPPGMGPEMGGGQMPPGMGMPAGIALGGGVGAAPSNTGAGVSRGPMMSPNAPNPDEVRRMMNRR